MKNTIEIPIQVITEKVSNTKQDSIFYAGKDIAKVVLGDREYILTTAGEYKFNMKDNDDTYYNERSSVVKTLTDKRVQHLNLNGYIHDWGWFGINLRINDVYQDIPTDCYSSYDEAMSAFKEYIEKNIA